MKISIEFDTDNAAFDDNPHELEFVLEQAARKISQGGGSLLDSNGNTIGKVTVELDRSKATKAWNARRFR